MKLLTTLLLVLAAAVSALAPPRGDSLEAIQMPATDNTDRFHPFSMTVTETCQKTEKQASAVWTSYGFNIEMPNLWKDKSIFIQLGRGTNLYIEYDAATSWVNFYYGPCKWGQNESKQCGWCRGKGWSAGPLRCGAPGSRKYTMDCIVNMEYKQGADEPVHAESKRKLITARMPSLEVDNAQPTTIFTHSYESLPTTQSPACHIAQDIPHSIPARDLPSPIVQAEQVDTQKASKTIILAPKIIQTSTAQDPDAEILILPFHFQTTEYCANGARKAKGRYSNGNVVADIDLSPGVQTGVNHQVPGFPPFYIGPFDYNASKVRFTYTNGAVGCRWSDDETWRQCGECRAGLWSGPALNCGSGGSRVKDMDCSFILGVKS
ncbi:Nn.00g104230.m01.CDS01 [Neocucurbitaria sp. VM-36]